LLYGRVCEVDLWSSPNSLKNADESGMKLLRPKCDSFVIWISNRHVLTRHLLPKNKTSIKQVRHKLKLLVSKTTACVHYNFCSTVDPGFSKCVGNREMPFHGYFKQCFKSPAIAACIARYSLLRQGAAICVYVQFSRYIPL
jgi:hypothetical protein